VKYNLGMYEFFFRYSYAFGSLAFLPVWLAIYHYRKDLRDEIFFGSAIGVALAMLNFHIWVPEYWNPPVFFNLPDIVGFSIEDILFGTFVGGTAAAVVEFALGERLRRVRKDHAVHIGAVLLLVSGHIGIGLLGYPLLSWVVGTSLATLLIAWKRRDLLPQIFIGGILFMTVYGVIFKLMLLVFPLFVTSFYNLSSFSGLDILGVPIEEFIFGLTTGMVWSVLYEYTRSFRISK
jgi:hypothetical protein